MWIRNTQIRSDLVYFAQGKHKWFFFVCTISYFYMKHLLHQPRLVFFAHVTLDVIRRWGRRDSRKSKRMAAATNFKIFAFDKSFLISCKCNYIPTTVFASIFMSLFHRSKIRNLMVMRDFRRRRREFWYHGIL